MYADQRGYPEQYLQDARVHCAVLKVRKMTHHTSPPAPEHIRAVRRQAGLPQSKQPDPQLPGEPRNGQSRPTPSGPNSVPTTRPPTPTTFHTPKGRTSSRRSAWPNWSAFHPRAPSRTPEHPRRWGHFTVRARLWTTTRVWRPVLLRKEVIQPHLPVRLPCYDFVPIADPAFDGSLHKGWATGFGRYRLS